VNTTKLYFSYLIFSCLPLTRLFKLKTFLLNWSGAKLGNNVRVASTARFYITGNLTIGDNTWVGHDALVIGGDADVSIGRDCDIATRAILATGSHELFTVEGKAAGTGFSSQITVGDGVWIGTAATVLGGVSLGNQSMIAASALVREDVEKHSVVAGVPAQIITTRQ
jgi:maltose O-acetyltransferase